MLRCFRICRMGPQTPEDGVRRHGSASYLVEHGIPSKIGPVPRKVQFISQLLQFVLNIPPPAVASFAENVQLVTMGLLADQLYIPPPVGAVFPKKVEFVTESLSNTLLLYIPPPCSPALLCEKVHPVIVFVPLPPLLYTPPPSIAALFPVNGIRQSGFPSLSNSPPP